MMTIEKSHVPVSPSAVSSARSVPSLPPSTKATATTTPDAPINQRLPLPPLPVHHPAPKQDAIHARRQHQRFRSDSSALTISTAALPFTLASPPYTSHTPSTTELDSSPDLDVPQANANSANDVNAKAKPNVNASQRSAHTHVVLKFGGTSVAKHLPIIVDTITPSLHTATQTPILVCSAQSYTVKEEGTTQRLLAAIDAALAPPASAPAATPVLTAATQAPATLEAPAKQAAVKTQAQAQTQTKTQTSTPTPPLTPPPTPPQTLPLPHAPQLGLGIAVTATPTTTPTHPSTATSAASASANAKPTPTPRSIIAEILERHLVGARKVIFAGIGAEGQEWEQGGENEKVKAKGWERANAAMQALERDLRADCERVVDALEAIQTLGEISPRTRDTVVAAGELMACRAVVAALHSRSIPARLVNLTDLVLAPPSPPASPSSPQDAQLDCAFFDTLVASIRARIDAQAAAAKPGETPPVLVATGFFGPIPGSLLEKIGRGYTDVCAALCARAVAADELQIWKEVDGVFSADPRKIVKAKLLPEISRNQAKLLTSYGSEVVHHLTIDQATHLDIPIVVKNVVNPTSAGTRIVAAPAYPVKVRRPVPTSTAGLDTTTPTFVAATPTFAVTVLHNLEMVHVHFDDWELAAAGHPLVRVMDIVREHVAGPALGLGLDLVNAAQGDVCFMVRGPGARGARGEAGLRKALSLLGRDAAVTTTPGMSYVQVVFMTPSRRGPAVACKTFGALADEEIDVKMISHGPMEYGVGCVVAGGEAMRAASVVHDALLGLAW